MLAEEAQRHRRIQQSSHGALQGRPVIGHQFGRRKHEDAAGWKAGQ